MNFEKYETDYKNFKYLKKHKVNGFEKEFDKKENNLIVVYPEEEYQEILGFGGAITESSGYVFSKFDDKTKEEFINDYFSENGIGYNFCRLPIGSCDFSLTTYSYSEKEDLSDFSVEKDKKYIIPLVKYALEKNPSIKFIATPWSPPKFMKTNNNMNSGGKLKDEYKSLWAQYEINYLKEYEKENIKIEYLTVQNEPMAKQLWESCLFSDNEEADYCLNYLYPSLKANNLDCKIIIWDHNKERLVYRADSIFGKDKNNVLSGIGYHYYTGDHFENIELVRKKYEDKLIIHTEGCCGISVKRRKRQIPNAEIYAHDIIGDLNSGANAYIDWNILLDFKGGPNHTFNFCNSPIMANLWGNKYKKNACFYYIGHFSKFIKPGAKRIAHSKYSSDLELVSFKNPDGKIIIVLMNKTSEDKGFSIVLKEKFYSDKIRKHSIITYVI